MANDQWPREEKKRIACLRFFGHRRSIILPSNFDPKEACFTCRTLLFLKLLLIARNCESGRSDFSRAFPSTLLNGRRLGPTKVESRTYPEFAVMQHRIAASPRYDKLSPWESSGTPARQQPDSINGL